MPKVELVIIVVFVASFLIWAVSKCNRQHAAADGEDLAETIDVDSIQVDTPAVAVPAPAKKPEKDFQAQRFTRLYVVIDGLNLRKTPELNGEVLVQLPLYEEVFFLNEVTDSTFQINLGYETADEPWVKVRSKKGHEGWVYGAGVNYYKKKREGVLE